MNTKRWLLASVAVLVVVAVLDFVIHGVLLSGIFAVAAALGGRSGLGEILVFGPALAMAGAVSAAGSLVVVRRAERRALPGDRGD